MPDGQSRRLVLAVTVIAVFMAILDTSIVNVAIPKMMAVFGVGTSDIQWILTAYTLVVGAIIPVTGYLTERYGFKKIFLFALAIFTIGSLLCGLAWNNESMIIFRIIQAIGGGALMPVSQAMIFRLFPVEKRGQAMGIFGLSIMFAPAVGPTLSGYLIQYLDWRLIFYINVPIGIVAFLLAFVGFKELEHHVSKKFDIWGFITSSVGFSTLLYGTGIVPEKGWQNVEVITFLSIGIISLLIFIAIEWFHENPMLDIKLIKNPVFAVAQIITSFASVILFVPLFIFPIFLQNIEGLSSVQTGLLLLPQALVTGVMMPISGALYDRIGARWLAVGGMTVTAISVYLTTTLDVNTPFSMIIVWLMLRGIGISMVMMPVSTAGMSMISREKLGQATALSNAFRQVSASFGIAWATLLMSQRQVFHVQNYANQFNMFSTISQNIVGQIQNFFVSMGQSVLQARQSALAVLEGQIQVHAEVQAMSDVFYVTVWLAIIAAVIAFFIGGKKEKTQK